MLKYPARLAINPVVSTMGFDVNRIFSELPIVALVLALPELGELLLKSFIDLDMYVAGAVLLILTFLIVFMNFIGNCSPGLSSRIEDSSVALRSARTRKARNGSVSATLTS